MSDASVPTLTKCRRCAPKHSYGRVWTPDHRRYGGPYIVDNGEYQAAQQGREWSAAEWRSLLDVAAHQPFPPDFVVLPDVYNDAEATLARHREHIEAVTSRGLRPAAVLQPGMDAETQVQLADRIGAGVVFVGGDNRWKRAVGEDIVSAAHNRGMAVHIGNPGLPGGLEWAQGIGVDSVDTSTIAANQAYHHLDELDGLSNGSRKKGGKQVTLNTEVSADD
jgi:hypothetical protein